MAWICGKHLGVEVADGQGCRSCNPPYSSTDESGKTVQRQAGTVGAVTKTLFKAGTAEYTAWDTAAKAGNLALVKQLEDAARAK